MSIVTISIIEAACDICGRTEHTEMLWQNDFRKLLRKYGWVFGKKDKCPECAKKTIRNKN